MPRNFYDDVGGAPVFHKIVARFYEEVAADPVLRPLYPEEDLGPAEERLRMFLEQYWGGPRTYSDQRGHPRLRMRHFPFRIGPTLNGAWRIRSRGWPRWSEYVRGPPQYCSRNIRSRSSAGPRSSSG